MFALKWECIKIWGMQSNWLHKKSFNLEVFVSRNFNRSRQQIHKITAIGNDLCRKISSDYQSWKFALYRLFPYWSGFYSILNRGRANLFYASILNIILEFRVCIGYILLGCLIFKHLSRKIVIIPSRGI